MTDAANLADPTTRRSSYALMMGLYASLVSGAVAIGRLRRVRVPAHIDTKDLVLMTLATQRLARLVARDPVTSPIRAPFTEFVEVAGPAELHEKARDDSKLRHTAGELITCPFCIGQWVATGFVAGQVLWPRATRLVSSTFAVVGVADALQHVVSRLRG